MVVNCKVISHWYCGFFVIDIVTPKTSHNINVPWGHNINGTILAKFWIWTWGHNINGIDIANPWTSNMCTISMVHGCIISMVRFGKVWGWDMGSQYQWHWYCDHMHLFDIVTPWTCLILWPHGRCWYCGPLNIDIANPTPMNYESFWVLIIFIKYCIVKQIFERVNIACMQ